MGTAMVWLLCDGQNVLSDRTLQKETAVYHRNGPRHWVLSTNSILQKPTLSVLLFQKTDP